MAICPPSTAINRILAALGLENVRSLKISAEVNSAVAVVTEQYVTGTQMDDLAVALETKEWVLVPKNAGRWIPVSERLPDDETELLVAFEDKTLGVGFAVFHHIDENEQPKWTDGNGCELKQPTHWMPLPEPPEVK